MNNLMDTLVISLTQLNIMMLLLHSCIAVETNYSVVVGQKDCSQRVSLRDPAQTVRLIVDPVDCVSQTGTCKLFFEAEDSFVKKMYQVCADGNNWPIVSKNCASIVTITSVRGASLTIICNSKWPRDRRKCSTGGIFVSFQSFDICDIQGEMSVSMEKTRAYANSYDLSDISHCNSSRRKEQREEQQITSWYNSSIGANPSFCQIEINIGWDLKIRGFCLNFHHAHFPVAGAKLIVERHQLSPSYLYSDEEYTSEKEVQLDVVNCFPIFGSSYVKGLYFYIKPNDQGGTGNQRYDHAFFLTLTFQKDEPWVSSGWDADEDDSGDYTFESDDSDSEFQKKVIIAVAVFCVAMFVCCYYACSKSKQQSTNSHQDYLDDPGIGQGVVRAPYYESEPLTIERHDEMPVYIHPTRTIIDDPMPQQPSPHEQRANRSNADIASAGFDQAPPQYTRVSPTPSAPPASRTGQPAGHQPTAPPPAYESLFPQRE